MSEAWANLEDVVFSDAAADAYATGCRGAANVIRGQVGERSSAVTKGSTDFKGLFSELFTSNASIASADATEIATRLDDVAEYVDFLKEEAKKEQQRREAARAWAKAEAEEGLLDKAGDVGKEVVTLGMADTDAKPEGPQSAPPPKTVAATTKPRETPSPGGGTGGSGTSSARPANLRDFASTSRGANTSLEPKPARLRGLATDFASQCQYGGIDASGVLSAFEAFNTANDEDVRWANAVAGAFEQAGGEGGITTLSDNALFATLASKGIDATRDDIVVNAPSVFGVNPSSGYVDDPVHAATGNFIELESDLGFAGGCATLQLTRTYNSFDTGTGAFGSGWSSWTEVALDLDDEEGRLTLPDGRQVRFPRLGHGWDRATTEAMWLERDEAADELRVTDNDGLTWRFATTGVPLSRDRGEGTMVSFVHEGGRLVRLQHERGRHIALAWEGDRVVRAETSDGRTMHYTYDDGLHLVVAAGPSGARTYRWCEAGLIDAVVDPDGVVEVENTYDGQGRVASQRSQHGRTSRYVYLPGNVTVVSDLDGTRSNTWISDRRGRLVGVIDAEGHRQSTSYDGAGNPVLVTERDGSVTVRQFDARGRLVREVQPSGADLSFAYDELDRVVKVVTEAGAETVCTYDGTARTPSLVVDPEGGATRWEWEGGRVTGLLDPTGVSLRFTYDQFGDLVSSTDATGATATLQRDGAGRVVASTTPSGHRTTYVYGPHGLAERQDPDGSVWHFERTTAGRLTAVVDPLGGRTETEYGDDGEARRRIDPLGRATERRLDDLGNLASVELPDGSTWRFTHDALSRLVESTSPEGQTWAQTYGSNGELAASQAPSGERVEMRTDRARGILSAQDAAGAVTHRFDALGRPVSTELPDGSVAMATYDRRGLPVELLDPAGGLTRIGRDAAGRPVSITSPTGAVTRFEHDACGRRSAVVDPLGARTTIEHDADGRPVRITLPTGEAGWNRYDPCGRLVERYLPGVGTTRIAHDAVGRVVEVKDTSSGRRSFTYDAVGQLVGASDANGGTTRYDYDARGRAVAITDPLGHVTRREFDAMDRCVAETDPLGRTTRAGYDTTGRQVWQEDASGRRMEWTYDGTGELTAVAVDGRTVSRRHWDPRNRVLRVTDHTRADGRVVEHAAEWDRRGLLVRRTRDDATMEWSYDAAGQRTSMTLPDGEVVGYRHDVAGRLVAVDHPLLGRAAFEHDAAGRIRAAVAGDLRQEWSFEDGFVVGHTCHDDRGSRSTLVQRDGDGRVLAVQRDGEVTSFVYDAACQLVEASSGGVSVRWRYDAAGRIVAESSEAGVRELAHDAAGQLISEEGVRGAVRHSYDAAGRRVRTERADGTSRDLEWSPTGWLASVAEHGAGGTVRTRVHVDATGQLALLDDAEVWWDSADVYAPSLVQVGSIPVVAGAGLTAVGTQWRPTGWRASREQAADPWAVAAGAGASDTSAALPEGVVIGAAGELTIAGLEWLGARVYDASSRGFLSVDPLDPIVGAGWSGNPYSYAGNDPLHALDPTGLKPITESELADMNRSWAEKAWDASSEWVKDNTDYLIGGAIALGGVILMFAPIPGAQILGMAAISAGADVILQRAKAGEDGKINVKQVLVSAAIGGAGAGVGTAFKAAQAARYAKYGADATKISLATKVGVQGGVGAVGGGGYEVAGGAEFGSREMWAGAAGGGIGGGLGPVGEHLGSMVGTNVTRRLGDLGSGPVSLPRAIGYGFQGELGSVANGATRTGMDFANGAVSQTADQIIRPGDQDAGSILDKGGQKALTGRVSAGVGAVDKRLTGGGGAHAATTPSGDPIPTPGFGEGSGKPIGSIVDSIF